MEIDIQRLVDLVNGRIVGNIPKKITVNGVCAVDKYLPQKVTFIRNKKYIPFLDDISQAVVLIKEEFASLCKNHPQNTYVIVEDTVNSIIELQDFFYGGEEHPGLEGISPSAKIDSNAIIGKNVYIGENASIGKNVVIGDRTKIMANSTILEGARIGRDSVINPGAFIYRNCLIGDEAMFNPGVHIGIDGFRYEYDVNQMRLRKLVHVGSVTIGNRVEIGSNSSICRATFEGSSTLVSDDVKIGSLVAIAHNVKIGARTIIAAETCISGSTQIGEDVWIGVGVSVSNSLSIGNRAKVLLSAVVAYDVADDEIVSGFYAMPHKHWKRVFRKLREIGSEPEESDHSQDLSSKIKISEISVPPLRGSIPVDVNGKLNN